MRKPLLVKIDNKTHFSNLLEKNEGLIIIKFGADWCGPCKMIEDLVHTWIDKMPENVQSIILDVDECFEIYAFLKSKKMVNGIPAILAYEKGNTNYIPDDAIIGADNNKINEFFERCIKRAGEL